MAGQIEDNKNLFTKYSIPFREHSKDQIAIDTAKVTYIVDLTPFKNNKFVFKITNKSTNKSNVEAKDVFIRKMCRHFKLNFVHWDYRREHKENQYTKKVPERIVIGGEYTTTWANFMAVWTLSEVMEDDQVILLSPKNKRKTLSKLSDLRVWVTKH